MVINEAEKVQITIVGSEDSTPAFWRMEPVVTRSVVLFATNSSRSTLYRVCFY